MSEEAMTQEESRPAEQCRVCEGTGRLVRTLERGEVSSDCGNCGGTGVLPARPADEEGPRDLRDAIAVWQDHDALWFSDPTSAHACPLQRCESVLCKQAARDIGALFDSPLDSPLFERPGDAHNPEPVPADDPRDEGDDVLKARQFLVDMFYGEDWYSDPRYGIETAIDAFQAAIERRRGAAVPQAGEEQNNDVRRARELLFAGVRVDDMASGAVIPDLDGFSVALGTYLTAVGREAVRLVRLDRPPAVLPAQDDTELLRRLRERIKRAPSEDNILDYAVAIRDSERRREPAVQAGGGDEGEVLVEVLAALGGAIEQVKALGSEPHENAKRALERGIASHRQGGGLRAALVEWYESREAWLAMPIAHPSGEDAAVNRYERAKDALSAAYKAALVATPQPQGANDG